MVKTKPRGQRDLYATNLTPDEEQHPQSGGNLLGEVASTLWDHFSTNNAQDLTTSRRYSPKDLITSPRYGVSFSEDAISKVKGQDQS